MPATSLRLHLEPGERVTLQPISWRRFEAVLSELGERRSSRIAYANGILEIMAPLPEHEQSKVLIADLVKILLKVQKRRCEPLGSTTFKRSGMAAGIEPDDCFYIENYQAVIGQERLDLSVDPSPDLALETDFTSKIEIDAYRALGIPELWIYAKGQLTINLFDRGEYHESQTSAIFSDVNVCELIPACVQRAKVVGASQALEEFEALIRSNTR